MNNVNCLGLLMDAYTEARCGPCLTGTEIEWMQMSVEIVNHPADVRIGTKYRTQLITIQQPQVVVRSPFLVFLLILNQSVHLTLLKCDFDEPAFKVAADLIFLNSPFNDVVTTVVKGPYFFFAEKAS